MICIKADITLMYVIYAQFDGMLFQQKVLIPMGNHCAQLRGALIVTRGI